MLPNMMITIEVDFLLAINIWGLRSEWDKMLLGSKTDKHEHKIQLETGNSTLTRTEGMQEFKMS